MKRSFSANIDGQIFYIDEDAFKLLKSYLEQLHLTFTGTEGQEIVSDIESRIRELFQERIDSGKSVITIADVSKVIETMGSPEALGGSDEEPGVVPPPISEDAHQEEQQRPFISFNMPGTKKLFRNEQNKVFGGVFGGLATYLGWNANIMRFLYVVLMCFTYFWPLILLYLLVWMVLPIAETPTQRLQMNGEPVNVDTLGQAVIATEVQQNYDGGFWNGLFSLIGRSLMGLLGLISSAIMFGCMVAFLTLLAGVVAFLVADSATILSGMDLMDFQHLWPGLIGSLAGFGAAILVFGLISWSALSVAFNFKNFGKKFVISVMVIAMLLVFAALVLVSIGMAL